VTEVGAALGNFLKQSFSSYIEADAYPSTPFCTGMGINHTHLSNEVTLH